MDEASQHTRRPRPEEHTDYRDFLSAMVDYLKRTNPRFSYRWFARVAGFSSPNFLQLVATGRRNLSADAIPKFARGLGLDAGEAAVFSTLVHLGQARDDAARNHHYAELRQHAARRGSVRRMEAAQFDAYSNPMALAIRELIATPGFREDPAWIARRLRPRNTPTAVRRALEKLLETGLVERDEQGRLRSVDRTISTGPQVRSLAVRNYHREMLALASRSLDEVPVADRDLTALTVAVGRAEFEEIRRRVERFRSEILELADGPVAEDAEVYQLAVQLFPLTRKEMP
jgi:uncharacterized protein (TIGR02147 family)